MYDGLIVIDADAHKMENPVVFFDYLDAPYRGRLVSRTDRHGQPRLVIRDLDPRTGRPELERVFPQPEGPGKGRSEEHTSELQSRPHLVCRLLLEKKKKNVLELQRLKKKKKHK